AAGKNGLGGQFQFLLPPAGQAIFTGSRKTSEEFELKNGRTIEFKVDLIEGVGKDSFAVLGFIPTANSLGTLAGYGLSKSTTDILLTKGIGKYFYNENPSTPIKNENVTLVLALRAKDGTVTIKGQVLDKDNGNAVLWEQTVTDTPAADVLADGTDDPAAPYLTSGHFALFCYEDFDRNAPQAEYKVIYDNAETCVLDEAVLDDFDDNTKTDWSDFTFVPGLGLPVEQNQQFEFTLPPAGQALFTGSRKTSRAFDLRECGHLQFRVDLVHGEGKDSFAVLAFIPEANSLGTLAGYGLSKSTTDILLTKGIGKYFYNEDPSTPIKNDNVTLVLDLTVSNNTTVFIKGQVLDKDANNAVLWEQLVVDTPDADVLADGTDDPAAPYITTGHFSLLCYEDFDRNAPQAVYQVIYDNASVLAPALTANQPPQISDVTPLEAANFLPATTLITFKAQDDKPLADAGISVTLNGTLFNSGNGLTLTGSGNTRNVSLGGLKADTDYTAVLQVVDSDNVSNRVTLHLDTFSDANLVIEIEDFNFGSGGFFDAPVPIAEGLGPQDGSYNNQTGTPGIDYTDTRATPDFNTTKYRNGDSVRMQHTFDVARQKYTDAGGAAANVFDYDVGDIVAGEWLNYSRIVTPGSYLVYLRQSIVNQAQAEASLEKVTGDPFLPDQATVPLGSFLGRVSGFQYRNVPLSDASGNPVIVRLTDIETLRLHQGTTEAGDALISQNYLVFVPTADPGLQRCRVVSVSPGDGATVNTVTPTINVTIQNFDTEVQTDSILLKVNGNTVPATVTPTAAGATVAYDLSPLPPAGALNTAQVIFTDNFQVKQTNSWSFTVTYKSLNPANRLQGAPGARGFALRMVQAPAGPALDNSLARAEDQLAVPSPYPAFMDTNTIVQTINQNKATAGSAGSFPDDYPVPGLYDDSLNSFGNGDNDFAVEMVAYLDLAAGIYTFGAITDDGYKASAGAQLHDASSAAVIAFHNGGPANETFDFVVTEPGLYPFRFMWYERGGSAYGELFSVDRATAARTLINDPASDSAIKAYVDVIQVQLQSSAEVTGPYTKDPNATLDVAQKKFTVPANGEHRFYRLLANTPYRMTINLVGGNVEISYTTP
ncbi:MAG TPA: hypothetical protein VNU68_32200, partial [Verrucomicrobiae bacterium]|nr:hypothetical protein [Verrucomicrobiae bacterium]